MGLETEDGPLITGYYGMDLGDFKKVHTAANKGAILDDFGVCLKVQN